MKAYFRRQLLRIDRNAVFLLVIEAAFVVILVKGIVETRHELKFLPLFWFALFAVILMRISVSSITSTWRLAVLIATVGSVLVFLVTAQLVVPLANYSLFFSQLHYQQTAEGVFQIYEKLWGILGQVIGKSELFYSQFAIWWQRAFSGRIVHLEQPSTFVFGLAIFFSVIWFGWFLYRTQKVYLSFVPSLVLLCIFVDNVNGTIFYVAFLLGVSALLLVVFNHKLREANWEKAGFGYSLELRLDFTSFALLMFAIIFVMVYFMPSISVKELSQKIEEWKNPVEENTGSQPGNYTEIFSTQEAERATGVMPSNHLITTPPELLDVELFQVQVKPSQQNIIPIPYYWRVQTMDAYTGRGWVLDDADFQLFGAGEALQDYVHNDGEFVDLDIDIQSEQILGTLIYSGDLVSVNQPFEIFFRGKQDIPSEIVYGEVDNEQYSVKVIPSGASARVGGAQFSDAYTEWVMDTYLKLPHTIPMRVTRLAQILIQNSFTPYERAIALESYLRTIPYSLDVDSPPYDRDVVDYFLFDLKQGYCDYYASAMVVMARIVGLPARLVVGYAPGTYDADSHVYQITGQEGHTWVEIYFPDRGWVEFEPTAGRPPINRDAQPLADEQGIEPENGSPISISRISISDRLVYFSLAVIILFPVIYIAGERIWYLTRPHTEVLLKEKEVFYLLSGRFGISLPEAATLREIQAFIIERLADYKERPLRAQLALRIESVVTETAGVFGEIAYQGKPVESYKKLSLVTNLLRLRRFANLLGVLPIFAYPEDKKINQIFE